MTSTMRAVQPTRGAIDARRRGAPRDYLADPFQFGETLTIDFRVPDGGDPVSMEIAKMLHVCFCTLRHIPGAPSGAELGRRFGFSRQTWSNVSRGYRWPGHTVVIAVLAGIRDADHTARTRPAGSAQ